MSGVTEAPAHWADLYWGLVQINDPADCWPWVGALRADGYGWTWWGMRQVQAHRIAYLLTVGEIPPGQVVHHDCRNRACCNAAHLRAMTASDHAHHHWALRRQATEQLAA